jgi:hypothetical protein
MVCLSGNESQHLVESILSSYAGTYTLKYQTIQNYDYARNCCFA